MRHWRYSLLLITLAACTAPTTINPRVSDMEMAQEQEAQARAAKQAPLNFDEKKTYSEAEMEQFIARLTPIAKRVEVASTSMCLDLGRLDNECHFKVILDPSQKGLNAHADGQNVVVYPAMVDFAKNDNQLAFVIAHEFAHNIMRHVDSQRKNTMIGSLVGVAADLAGSASGVNTGGAFGKIGSQQGLLRYSSAFEAEADYVGLYILARGSFAIEQAPDFWRMMSQAEPNAIYISQTHPNNPARTIAMTKTVAEIRAKQAANQPLIPNIRPKE